MKQKVSKVFVGAVKKIATSLLKKGTGQYSQTDVIYLGYIGGNKFKYGQSSDFTKRLLAHKKGSASFLTFLPLKIFPCANGIASEKKVRQYVREKNLCVPYVSRGKRLREIIEVDSLENLDALTSQMQKYSEEPVRVFKKKIK